MTGKLKTPLAPVHLSLTMDILRGSFCIHRLSGDAAVPPELLERPFYALLRSEQELSIVTDARFTLRAGRMEPGWSCLRVRGPLDFSLTGVVASIAAALREANVAIFVLSSFDTDYVMIKEAELETAVSALRSAGIEITSLQEKT